MSKKEKDSLRQDLQKKVKELSALYEVGKTITSSLHLDETLNLITMKAVKLMGASSCSLRLLDEQNHKLVLRCAYGMNSKVFKAKKVLNVGESIAGRVMKEGRPCIINDIQKERRYKCPQIAKQKGLRSLITVPMVQRNRTSGVLSVYNKKACKYTKDDAMLLSMLAGQAAVAIENARLYEQAEVSYKNTVLTLSNIIDAKDSQTYGHSERVMEHCLNMADLMGFSKSQKEILRYASLLHDIGKIGIDIGILRKPSKLNSEEWKIVVMHPVLGSSIVEQIGFLKDLAPIILRHHERYDGKGYPGRLKNQKIPLSAKILSVADAYESMVSDRPYRKALSIRKARQELLDGSGTQFDPEVVKVFLKAIKKRKKRQ